MSAIAEHWENTLKRRLVELAITKGWDQKSIQDIAHLDLSILADLLEHTRYTHWQEGHDTALMHGQSENPYFPTRRKPR